MVTARGDLIKPGRLGSVANVFTGPRIAEEVAAGNIVIDPFDPERAKRSPNSYDVTLGRWIWRAREGEINMAEEPVGDFLEIPPEGYVIRPGRLVLGVTGERVGSTKYVPKLDGRSSVGRLGLEIHATAGFGDVGFMRHWTLEFAVTQAVRIFPGVRIGQVYFEPAEGAIVPYQGKYAADVEGEPRPEPSRIFREFTPENNLYALARFAFEGLPGRIRFGRDGQRLNVYVMTWDPIESAVYEGRFQYFADKAVSYGLVDPARETLVWCGASGPRQGI